MEALRTCTVGVYIKTGFSYCCFQFVYAARFIYEKLLYKKDSHWCDR